MASTAPPSDLFTSLISDIKTYSGNDPLLPWLRGIRRLRDSLPPQLLNEKLPRFLQKCAQTFQSDRRYRNDLRYIRLWLQLMDFVDDPKALLRTMENNRIGMKKSLFYQAHALYYEKNKKFEEAEKMYHLGVQNLAEPIGELQKSYEQFLHRIQKHKNKKIQRQEGKTAKRPLSSRSTSRHSGESEENKENLCRFEGRCTGTWLEGVLPKKPSDVENVRSKRALEEDMCDVGTGSDPSMKKELIRKFGHRSISKQPMTCERESDELRTFCSDDTVVVKFVDTAVVGKSEAEDACHHGLVDPTINMKEAMDAINSMFREPLETAPVGRRSHRSQSKDANSFNNGFEVFVDENMDKGPESTDQKEEKGSPWAQITNNSQSHQEPFQIYIDDEGSDENENSEQGEVQNAFVFPSPRDHSPESSDDIGADSSPRPKLRREDTVVRRFVGSAIADEPQVENVCHHGLVEPTINLKEAMDDINNMFGKPIDFVRSKRSRKQDVALPSNGDFSGFSILPDDDLEPQPHKPLPQPPRKSRENDLFEPTVFTKEAMDDINKLFGMPLDF